MTDDSGVTEQPESPTRDTSSRRKFLRNAVIGGAGVTAGAVAGGVLLTRERTHIFNNGEFGLFHGGSTSGKICSVIVEGSKHGSNPNVVLEISPLDLHNFPVGTCILLTAKAGNAPPFHTTVIATQNKQHSTHAQLCICPTIPVVPGVDEYPEGSTICVSTGCPTPSCDAAKCFP